MNNEPLKCNNNIELLINSIDGIVWEADAKTFQLTFVSKKAENILGYTVDEWLGDSFWQNHIHPDDKEWAINFCITSTREKKSHEFEYRMIAKDGSIVWLRDIVTVVIENNEAVFLRGIMIDITKQKKAEEIVQLSHQRLINAELLGKTGYWTRDAKSGKVTWSEGTYRIFDEVPGNFKENSEDFFRRVHPDDLGRLKAAIQELYKTKLPVSCEFRIKTATGEEKYLGTSAEAIFDNEGNPVSAFGNTIDLTERKKASEEIKNAYQEIRRLTDYLQNIREKERSNIAREIHDELGQQLTVLKMDISWLSKRIGPEDKEINQKIAKLIWLLDETLNSVRRISSSLRPGILDDLGLIAAMEWYLSEFEKHSGVETVFNHDEDEIILPDTFNTGLFRIFQESLTNVARHANAKRVKVTLKMKEDHLVLNITDDGNGFNKQIENKHTLGILGMKERTFMMGGTYHIKSSPGKGTSVMVTIPESRFSIQVRD